MTHAEGPPAVADFSGLDADDVPGAPVAAFDGGFDDPPGSDEALGPRGSSGDAGGDGASTVRVASFDGPQPGRARSPRPRAERAGSRRRTAPADPQPADPQPAGPQPTHPQPTGPQDDEARAKDICLRLLTDRARTVQELSQALRRKEIPDDVAARVLERFDEVGLVDDEAFAGQWVRSRHRHRGLGRRAIAAELHRKGVAEEIADEALTEIDAESEENRARELVDRKLRTVPIDTKEQRATAARRLVGMLARKGYGGAVAYRVVREAVAARGAEADELGEGPLD